MLEDEKQQWQTFLKNITKRYVWKKTARPKKLVDGTPKCVIREMWTDVCITDHKVNKENIWDHL